jgi:murein DD-endopeptidase MepM/ murein hydrolase activator NlpD
MKKATALIIILFLKVLPGGAETAGMDFPLISQMDVRDTIFKQYLADVETARRRIFNAERSGETAAALTETLTVYGYKTREKDDILSLAARCNIPYAALVTLNRLSHPVDFEGGSFLLIPSAPGIFIPENPQSDLERLLDSARAYEAGISISLDRPGGRERFRFIPGADFSPTERAFFLNRNFRFPLRTFRLTSAFGPRINPVTGVLRNHNGLDLAAPEGTEVFAARAGVVTEMGEDPVYGKYIIIRHGENWASLYGHLSQFDTALRREVESGSLIGRVGSTGQSTGPHLHFELRQNGQAQDPGKYLFQEGTGR